MATRYSHGRRTRQPEKNSSALRALCAQEAGAPVSFKTKPGSLLDANSPVVKELVHSYLEDELRHELRASRIVLLVRSDRLPEGGRTGVNYDLGITQAAGVKQRMVEGVDEFQ